MTTRVRQLVSQLGEAILRRFRLLRLQGFNGPQGSQGGTPSLHKKRILGLPCFRYSCFFGNHNLVRDLLQIKPPLSLPRYTQNTLLQCV
jgi:hypothetical protein